MGKKTLHHVNTKIIAINLVTSVLLNLFLEFMERKSFHAVLEFMDERSFMFFYNTLLIFMVLSPVVLLKKKYFAYAVTVGGCALVGLTNGIVLNNRSTPFTAVDLTIAKSILPVIRNYYEVWQIVCIIILMVFAIGSLVCLYLYSPAFPEQGAAKGKIGFVIIMLFIFVGSTFYGKSTDILHRHFDNLIIGYQEYGVAYGFVVTLCDTGIDRPIDYSREKIRKLEKKMNTRNTKLEKDQTKEEHTPNIIFIQLESFFDITTVKGLTCSKDPIPVIRKLQEEYTSGKLNVPVYGAGTINTEFEVISAMNTDYFGVGEYPYRSILHKTQCDSMAYWMRNLGYTSTVVHNNNASFYDRDAVFSNLGFDYFVSSENMNIQAQTSSGWAKDKVLTDEILNTMNKTKGKDYIYTISVQGHGDYPTTPMENPLITVDTGKDDEKYNNQVEYYTNQIYEMDAFIGELVKELEDYPEEVMLIAYGDHLPSLGYESSDIEGATKYQTPYFIWDNFGYNKKYNKEESEDVQAWQLAPKVLKQVKIGEGVLNRYHQTMSETKSYKKNLKLFQYDLLYGAKFALEDQGGIEPTQLQYSLNTIQIQKVKQDEKKYYLIGEGFTKASRVYVNGLQVASRVNSTKVISVSAKSIADGDSVVIHQVSETNEKTTLNVSEEFEFHEEKVSPLYNNTDTAD